MLLSIQFPLADVRLFLTDDTARLNAPPWPLVDPGKHFVRGFGGVRRRARGGVREWQGEEVLCDAHGALKFAPGAGTPVRGTVGGTVLLPIYRRFFATGNGTWTGAISRVDIGFRALGRAGRGQRRSLRQVSHPTDAALSCLTIPSRVPDPPFGKIKEREQQPRELMTQGPAIARRLLTVTTSKITPLPQTRPWWLSSCTPLVLVVAEYSPGRFDDLDILQDAKEVARRDNGSEPLAAVYFREIVRRRQHVPVWILLHDSDHNPTLLRNLRVHLWRLHVEREVLRKVVSLVVEKQISPRDSPALRDYLARQSQRLNRVQTEGFAQRDLLAYAYGLDSFVHERDLTTLRDVLREVSSGLTSSVMPVARPQPPDSTGTITNNLIINVNGDLMTGENVQNIHNAGNIGGVVGGTASVTGSQFQGQGKQNQGVAEESIDLDQLIDELTRLRAELKVRASEPDEDLAVAEVARAEKSARDGDKSAALSALTRAGTWAFGVATSIGTALVAAAIKSGLGV